MKLDSSEIYYLWELAQILKLDDFHKTVLSKTINVDDFDLWIKKNCTNNVSEGYFYKGIRYTKHKLFEVYKKQL